MTNYELYEKARVGDQIFVRRVQKLMRKIATTGDRGRPMMLDELVWETTPIEELFLIYIDSEDPDEGTELVPN